MLPDNMSESDSRTRLVKAPVRHKASPHNQDVDELLEKALDETDEYEDSTTSFI